MIPGRDMRLSSLIFPLQTMCFPKQLANRIWHTTTEERLKGILNHGSIVPEPNILDIERWGSAMGPEKYPFVRSIGGVSLFDFRGFKPEDYDTKYPRSSWRAFVPCRHDEESAIWIEIKPSELDGCFIDGKRVLSRWKESGELFRKIMPLIECAHIGPISISMFGNVLAYKKQEKIFKIINLENL